MKRMLAWTLVLIVALLCTGCGKPAEPAGSAEPTNRLRNRTAAPAVTDAPTEVPTAVPTEVPTAGPTAAPMEVPTEAPTPVPTLSLIMPAPTAEPTVVPAPTLDMNLAPDEAVVRRVLDAMGPDLIARAKEAGFTLSFSFEYREYDPWEGWDLPDDADKSPKLQISIELRSAVGSTMYNNNTVDCDLMREIQYAMIDAGVFDLTAADVEKFKSYTYGEVKYADELSESGVVNLHINETPGGYEAILYLRHYQYIDSRIFGWVWSSDYEWNACTWRR